MEWTMRQYIGTKEEQQDCLDVCVTENGLLAALCDGIGSLADAKASSGYAVSSMMEAYDEFEGGDMIELLLGSVKKIDLGLYEHYGRSGGTTCVFTHIYDNEMNWLSIGDSRLYIFRNGTLTQITHDHNYKYVLDKRLTNNEIDQDEYDECRRYGEALVSFLGMNGIYIADISTKSLELCGGDMILVTSDGLYKAIGDEMIRQILMYGGGLEYIADELLNNVKRAEKPSIDNTSFILLTV